MSRGVERSCSKVLPYSGPEQCETEKKKKITKANEITFKRKIAMQYKQNRRKNERKKLKTEREKKKEKFIPTSSFFSFNNLFNQTFPSISCYLDQFNPH